MKALKTTIDSNIYYLANPSEKGILTFIISAMDDEIKIDAGGYIPESNTHMDWIKSTLEVGSSLKVEVIDNADPKAISEPIAKRVEDSVDIVNRAKIKSYYKLKEELEEKGLI